MITFYYRGQKDGDARYDVGGSALRIELRDLGGEYELRSTRQDPADRRRRVLVEAFEEQFPTPLSCLRGYAIQYGYDLAFVTSIAGISHQIHPEVAERQPKQGARRP